MKQKPEFDPGIDYQKAANAAWRWDVRIDGHCDSNWTGLKNDFC